MNVQTVRAAMAALEESLALSPEITKALETHGADGFEKTIDTLGAQIVTVVNSLLGCVRLEARPGPYPGVEIIEAVDYDGDAIVHSFL